MMNALMEKAFLPLLLILAAITAWTVLTSNHLYIG
jgi:hypothetical protein